MWLKKFLKILFLGVILGSVNLSAELINNNNTIIKLVGVDKLPYDKTSGYSLSIGGTVVGGFPGGVKYYHGAQGGYSYTSVNNGVVTIKIPSYLCNNGPVEIKINRCCSDYYKILGKKNIICGRTNVIRIK